MSKCFVQLQKMLCICSIIGLQGQVHFGPTHDVWTGKSTLGILCGSKVSLPLEPNCNIEHAQSASCYCISCSMVLMLSSNMYAVLQALANTSQATALLGYLFAPFVPEAAVASAAA